METAMDVEGPGLLCSDWFWIGGGLSLVFWIEFMRMLG